MPRTLRLLDLALPPRCPACGAITDAADRFCVDCWGRLSFLAPPWCAGCNLPFAHDHGPGARCEACRAAPPRHAGVRAAVAYGEVARTLALRLKYGGRTGHARTAALLMRRLVPADTDLLVPVPLHRWRLWRRGYNQAALIAAALGRAAGVPSDARVLERTRATPSLRGLPGAARRRAVAGAFRLSAPQVVAGRRVALVDDVFTSGATADACVDALLAGGAAAVTVLAWARVIDAGEVD